MKKLNLILLATAFFMAASSFAQSKDDVIFTQRDLINQENNSIVHLIKNISTQNLAAGSVSQYRAVSPMEQNVHSTRDAALAMEMTLQIYTRLSVGNDKNMIRKLLLEQLQFNQKTIENSLKDQLSLGNSFFNLIGEISPLIPARPQTEAAAMRAIASIKLFNLARAERWPEFPAIRRLLYDNTIGSKGLLKLDLDFTQKAWSLAAYDLWGQVKGRHFATLMLQKKALLGGSQIASFNGDLQSARNYQAEATKINRELSSFWDASKNSLRSSKPSLTAPTGRLYLWDSSILYAVLEGQLQDGTWDFSDERILASIDQMQEAFRRVYPANQNENLGPAIGRYPEENQGQPLVQMTNMLAEYYYQLALELNQKRMIKTTDVNVGFYQRMAGSTAQIPVGVSINSTHPVFKAIQLAIVNEGDRVLARSIVFKNNDGSLSEQFSRVSGNQQGFASSTAATASFLSAKSARDRLVGSAKSLKSLSRK